MISNLTRERIEWLNYAATGLAANGTEMAMSPQDVIALTEYCLAGMDSEPNRNPVLAYADSYRDMAKQGVESVQIWSVITDLERNIAPLYRHAQPAPVVPATLPCAVELKPGLIIGKGCKTETLLTALQRRADYYAEIDAMTPEERAEYDANIEAFKAMLPQPALVVPEEKTLEQISAITAERGAEYSIRDSIIAAKWWNACRATMLNGGKS